MSNVVTPIGAPIAELHLQCFEHGDDLTFRFKVHGDSDDIGAMILSISEKSPALRVVIAAAGSIVERKRQKRRLIWQVVILSVLTAVNIVIAIFHR